MNQDNVQHTGQCLQAAAAMQYARVFQTGSAIGRVLSVEKFNKK